MATSNNVTIVPGRASSLATALRGHINAVLAYMRIGDSKLTEKAIADMRRDLTMFETEVRLNIKED
jgi:hypothetical protein